MKSSYHFLNEKRIANITIPDEIDISPSLERIYLLIYGIYTALFVIDSSLVDIHFIMKIYMLLTGVMLSGIAVFQQRYKVSKLFAMIIIMLVFSLVAIVADKTMLIIIALFIIIADITDFEKIVKCSLVCSFSSLIFIVACSQVGILPDYIFLHNGMKAHCLGFSYYASFPYTIMFNMLSYMYLRGRKIRWLELGLLVVINYYVYLLSTTRLTFFLFIITIILFVLFVKLDIVKSFDKSFYKILSILVYPTAFFTTVWCALHYTQQSSFWRSADEFTNNRIALSHTAFRLYDVKWFGQFIEMNGNAHGNAVNSMNYFYIDSAYIYLILSYGIIFTAVIILAYSYLSCCACQTNNKALIIWGVALSFFSVINNQIILIYYNPILMSLIIEAKKAKLSHNQILALDKKCLNVNKA